MWFDRSDVKSKLASLDTFLGVPGPFTVELTQFISKLIGYYFIVFVLSSRESKCSLASLAFNAMGWKQCHTLLDQTASNRCPTHTEAEVCCYARSDASSSETHSANSCELKENDATQRQKMHFLYNCFSFFLGEFFGEVWLPLSSMNTHHWENAKVNSFQSL